MHWLVELFAAMGAVQRSTPLIATLATVDFLGRPRARSVVCRRIDEEDGSIWIASDARSEKNEHARETKLAELVIWLPQPREQFRLFGDVSVLDVSDEMGRRFQLWEDLSDATRAMFFWPTPGTPLEATPRAFPGEMPAGEGPPDSFEVLVLRPTQVERLQLQPHPHQRTRWRAEKGWRAEALNP
jgi:PPOX class probable FMN-dependent enzyme